MRVTRETLDALNHAGFIEFSASKPLANPEHDARPEAETDKEKEPPSPPSGNNRNGRRRKISEEELKPMLNVVDACQMFIEGHAWDETFDKEAMLEEFGRIERGHHTEGTLTACELNGLLEQWAAARQDRHGIKANLPLEPESA